jgi:hypothetical protein
VDEEHQCQALFPIAKAKTPAKQVQLVTDNPLATELHISNHGISTHRYGIATSHINSTCQIEIPQAIK